MVNYFKATPKTQKLGQQHTIKIKRLDFNGCGVGIHQQKNIFIDGTLPNETVVSKIIEQKSKYFRGKLIEVVIPNEQRVVAACQHFLICGGCDLQHLNPKEHLPFKQQKVTELFQRNGIFNSSTSKSNEVELPWQKPINSEPWHYRRKARIGVQYNKAGNATIGFRQRSSNQLVAIKKCPVLVKPMDDIFKPLNALLPKLSGKNPIGHIEVIVTNVTSLIVRQLTKLSEQDKEHWLTFAQQQQCQIMINDGKSILPLTSCEPLEYPIDKSIKLQFSAADFIQVNHDVNTKMVAQAIDWLTLEKQDKVLDLFCGLGNFSLPIAAKVNSVTGVEGVDNMVVQAKENAASNNLSNSHFYQADLNSNWQSYPWSKEKYNKVLIDPARAGAYQAIEQLVKFNIKYLLYVSCDPTTLAKDGALLLNNGYKIEKISLIDMFSQTKHIETMVLFVR
ncbi:MAG: 23S rRNA (uracil(1939)-C(5))-methyltransferase RlmD [Colwelliaceae bacterium]|nr:23S rRNA (uracil(1939)-C(5))-methyltransferase RlmD [Colwelliaceae bacterium]